MSEFFKFDWQKRLGETDISAPGKAVGMWLSTWMKMDGSSAYPSFQTLAKQSGYSITTVKKAMKELIQSGWVDQVRKGGSPTGGERQSNKYQARIPGQEATRSPGDSVAQIGVPGRLNGGTGSGAVHKQNINSGTNRAIFSDYGEMYYCIETRQWVFKEESENGFTEKNIQQTATN